MKKKTANIIVVSFCLTLLLSLSPEVFCQQDIDISGTWKGKINIPGMELSIIVEFEKTEGIWNGKVDIPQQNATNLPLTGILVKGREISFDLTEVPGNAKFIGEISENGKEISGDFSQSGQTFKFDLNRKSEAELEQENENLKNKLEIISAFIDATMRAWKVPGLAIALVKNGEVILSKGFGYRDIEQKKPVTENTLFAIGSSSKAFTAMTVASLVEEGILEWDQPVKKYIPSFKMNDEYVTGHMTPRDLVTHRCGLPRHDLMWYNSSFSRKEIFDRLQYLEPNREFRTTFQYQNHMFMTAGYLVGQVTNSTWEEQVKKRIFGPLGMKNSNFSVLESQESSDFAKPYTEKDDEVIEIPFRDITTIGPAGSINSNIKDMAEWVKLNLGKGKIGETKIISETQLKQIHSPHMFFSAYPENNDRIQVGYGLGWFIEVYRGHYVVQHGGNIDGFSAMVYLLPLDNIGMVILTNKNGTPVPTFAARYAADILFEKEPIRWHEQAMERLQKAKSKEKEEPKKEPERIKGTKYSHNIEEYTGEYEHPGYGILKIDPAGKKLKVTYNKMSTFIEHWHYDVFKTTDENEWFGQKYMLTFYTNQKGDIEKVSVPLEAGTDEIVFSRKAEKKLSEYGYLSKFEGKYDLSGVTVTVEIQKENVLTVTVPGQPTYDLEPVKENEFNLKGLSGYSVRFTVDKKGNVTKLDFLQPNGIFSAEKKDKEN